MMNYLIHIITTIGIYALFALSFNIILGYTGLINLGHVAIFGIGAYTSALLTIQGVPYIIALPTAIIITIITGVILYTATRKLKGDYFALATFGFSFVIISLMSNLEWLTRGPFGLPGIPRPVSGNISYLILTFTILIIITYLTTRLVRSPFGRLIEASRDDPIGLRVLGKNTYAIQAKAVAIGSGMAGIAGSLYAHYISYIEPNTFALPNLILILTIVIVGGLASIRGTIIATIIIIMIPEILRIIAVPTTLIGPLRQILYALILLYLLIMRPRGLFGRIDLDAQN